MSRIEYQEPDSVDEMLRGEAFEWNTKQALRGKKGQKVLRELEAALVGMPKPELIKSALYEGGKVCALGALALHRDSASGPSMEGEEYGEEYIWEAIESAADMLGITQNLAWAIIEQNDEACRHCTPEQRHERVLDWIRRQLIEWDDS